jgi:hypothetical protein
MEEMASSGGDCVGCEARVHLLEVGLVGAGAGVGGVARADSDCLSAGGCLVRYPLCSPTAVYTTARME